MAVTIKHKGGTYSVDTARGTATRIKGTGATAYTQVVKKRELLTTLLASADAAEKRIIDFAATL
jgi:hypothetical protein